MPSEQEAVQAIKARLLRDIQEARATIKEKQQEIAEAETYMKTLNDLGAYVSGKPLTEVTSQPTTKVTQCGTPAETPVEQTGWIKEEIVAFVQGRAPERFAGSDIARVIRAKGHKLTPYQYNSIYTTLKRMAAAGDLVQRIPGTAQYEKRQAPTALKLAERPATEEGRSPNDQ